MKCTVIITVFTFTMLRNVQSSVQSVSRCRITETGNFTLKIDCSNNGSCNVSRIPTFDEPMLFERIEVLNMSSCYDLIPTADAFLNYTNLKVLDLHKTSLKAGNITFAGLRNLEYLDVSQNEQFPLTNETSVEPFLDLVSLKKLKAYGTTGTYYQFEGYPEYLLQYLGALKELWLDARNISFGPSFEHLTNLEKLRISGDKIEPPWRSPEFCELTNITHDMVRHLKHIKKLYIRKCGLKTIAPKAFSHMTKLEFIDLSLNNALTVVGGLKALDSISQTVEEAVLNSIEDVDHLRCNVEINGEMTNSLRSLKLKKISLENNAINSLTSGAFEHLPHTLEHLNLRKNEFELAFYLFYAYKARSLKTLDIAYNFFNDDFALFKRSGKYSKPYVSPEPRYYGTRVNTPFHEYFTRKCAIDESEDCHVGTVNNDHVKQFHQTGPAKVEAKCPKSRLYIPAGVVTAYIPPTLESIDFSFSKLAVPIYAFHFDKNNKLREIKAAGSLLYCWQGPFHGLDHLEVIDLSLNDCAQVSQQFFSKFPKLKVLNVSRNLLELPVFRSEHGELFAGNRELRLLNMSFNHIQFIPRKFLLHQNSLETLDLSQNGLQDFDIYIEHMVNLTTIDLTYNHILSLSPKMQEQFTVITNRGNEHVLLLDMSNNPIECSCGTLDFIHWIYKNMASTQTLQVQINHCFDPTTPNATFTIYNQNMLNERILDLEMKCASYTSIIVVATLMCVVFMNVVVGVFVHRFRWKIRFWYYVVSRSRERETRQGYEPIDNDDSRFMFDVYVASIHDDKSFVLEKLKPRFDSKYRMFIQDIDILPGQGLYRVISNAVHVSKVALFIVSEHSETDSDLQTAVHFVKEETLKRKHRMTLGLFLNSRRVREWPQDIHVIRRESFIDYPDSNDPTKISAFWQETESKISELFDNVVARDDHTSN